MSAVCNVGIINTAPEIPRLAYNIMVTNEVSAKHAHDACAVSSEPLLLKHVQCENFKTNSETGMKHQEPLHNCECTSSYDRITSVFFQLIINCGDLKFPMQAVLDFDKLVIMIDIVLILGHAIGVIGHFNILK